MKSRAVFGIVHSAGEADDLISALLGEGFPSGDIALLLPSGSAAAAELGDAAEVRVPTGAIVGAGTGVVLGGLLGLIASSGAIAGIDVETTSAVAMLASAAVFGPMGSAVGGILGHLSEPAEREEPSWKEAHFVVSFSSDDSAELESARVVFASRGAADIAVTADARALA